MEDVLARIQYPPMDIRDTYDSFGGISIDLPDVPELLPDCWELGW